MFFVTTSVARADTFVLNSGGRIEGELVNRDQSPRRDYIILTAAGARVTLAKSQVKQVLTKSSDQRQYESLLPRMPDTADGNWKMAEWLKDRQRLSKQREFHLRKVIDHDPNHALARRALGFGRDEDGDWVHPDEYMKSQGFVLHRGDWKLPQEVAILEARKRVEDQQNQWNRQLRIWRGWMGGRRHADAKENFLGIDDPAAANGLALMLVKERDPIVRQLYIQVLGNLEGSRATAALIKCALEEDLEGLREDCIIALKERGGVSTVLSLIAALKSKNNHRINRAAVALAELGNSAAVLPLIDALETEHKYVSNGSGGNLRPTFSPSGGGGLGVGGGPKIVRQKVHNARVLAAILALTEANVNFLYDEEKWKQWYAQQNRPAAVNLRRDS